MRSNFLYIAIMFCASLVSYGEEVKFNFESSKKSMDKNREKLYINVLDKVTIPFSESLGDVSFEVICDVDILNFNKGSLIFVSTGNLKCKIASTEGGRVYRIGGLKLDKRDQYKKVTLVLRYCSFTRSTCILVKDGEKIIHKSKWEKQYLKKRFNNFSVATLVSKTREGGKKKRGAAMKREIPENTTGKFTELQDKTIVCNRGYLKVAKKKRKGAEKENDSKERKRNVDFKVTPIAINIVEYGFEDSLKR